MKMKNGWLIVLMLVSLLSPGSSVYAEAVGNGSPEKTMENASKAIDEGELDAPIASLEGIQKEGLSNDSLSRLHFLLGKAKYIKMITEIRECRSDGTQKTSELQDHQVEPLVVALDHLNTYYELSPDSDWAPEALYATGLIQDYGCLQRFESAVESYRVLAEKYPDTDLGKAAAQRYKSIKARMDGKGHGPAHP
jgi:hypothetical protein